MTRAKATHHVQQRDDSGLTSVVRCECGVSFLGVGAWRVAEAELQWERHLNALTGKTVTKRDKTRQGTSKTVTKRDKTRQGTSKPAKGADVAAVAEAVLLMRGGMSVSKAAAAVGIPRSTLALKIKQAGYGDLIAKPGWGAHAWVASVASRHEDAA